MTIESRPALDQLASRQLPSPPVRLDEPSVQALLAQLPPVWRIEAGMLRRRFALPDYAAAVALVVAIGALADQLNHHPELTVKWGEVGFAVETHDVSGLSELDFILAAKVERAAAGAAG